MNVFTLDAGAFDRLLPSVRSSLLLIARQNSPCQEDAEDRVSETVLLALHLLPKYPHNPETGADGLLRWLTGILRFVLCDERKQAARRPKTLPICAAARLPAPPPTVSARHDPLLISHLPFHQRGLVTDWLNGYTQQEIGRRHDLHRNTVANRLELAFETLRKPCPDADELTYKHDFFDWCATVTIYSKPQGVWRSWRNHHPPEPRFTPRPRIPRSVSRRKPRVNP